MSHFSLLLLAGSGRSNLKSRGRK